MSTTVDPKTRTVTTTSTTTSTTTTTTSTTTSTSGGTSGGANGAATPTSGQQVADRLQPAANGRQTSLGLPGTSPTLAAAVPEYGPTFDNASYVKDGKNAQLLGLMGRAAGTSPQLADLQNAVKGGEVSPENVKSLQSFLSSKGFNVGKTGADGKFGPRTHAALAAYLRGEQPSGENAYEASQKKAADASPASTPTSTTPTSEDKDKDKDVLDPATNPNAAGKRTPGDPSSYFISQYPSKSNPNEDTASNGNCGPTSMLMIAKAFGKTNPTPAQVNNAIEDVRRRGGATREERTGHGSATSIDQLKKAAESFGLNATAHNNAGMDGIKSELAKGNLVLTLVKPGAYSNSRSTGHYVVVTKIEGNKVYVNDPAKKDGPRVIDYNQFARAIAQKGGRYIGIGT